MFRISKGYDYVTKTIRLPEPIVEQLEKLAVEYNISLNQLVNQCVKFALENREKENESCDSTQN